MGAKSRRSRRKPWIPLAAGIAVLAVLVAVIVNRGNGEDETDSASETSEENPYADLGEELSRREADDPQALGEKDAPVVLIAYSDYNCPYCGRWSRETKPELMPYVDSGDLRIEWREFPYLGDDSTKLAHAAFAAGEQGRFWEFHNAYYELGEKYTGSELDEVISDIVGDLGLDRERFDEDRAGDDIAAAVEADFQEGLGIGVNATPTFLVNGQPILGAQPTQTFVDTIEKAIP
ncbi:DsbA family protein [Salininema proteolyticum]|uniref:DsbA family protein n=1 Tax=Salininema proteolyticum TaxID=1607685 RepID=A0ABV8TVV1_9ACTN